MSEYTEHADALLKEMGVTFEVRHVGNGCPPFCGDRDDMSEAGKFPRKKHIHGDQHLCILSRSGKAITFDFWNSYRDQEIDYFVKAGAWGWRDAPWYKKKKYDGVFAEMRAARLWLASTKFSPLPTSYDLLASLQKYEVGTFKDFCADFGYSDDSIRALETYRAAQEEFDKVRRLFTAAELEKLQEVA